MGPPSTAPPDDRAILTPPSRSPAVSRSRQVAIPQRPAAALPVAEQLAIESARTCVLHSPCPGEPGLSPDRQLLGAAGASRSGCRWPQQVPSYWSSAQGALLLVYPGPAADAATLHRCRDRRSPGPRDGARWGESIVSLLLLADAKLLILPPCTGHGRQDR